MKTDSLDSLAAANAYAESVVSGAIPACELTRLACKRHLDDQQRDDIYFDVDAADKAVAFIQELPHTKGRWAAKKELLVLSPWQVFIVACIFGWKNQDGLRRFREVYIEVCRKNGKSVLAAAIGLYMLLCDGEYGAEVYSGATTEKQAWEVFRPAKLMCQRMPDLCEFFGLDVNAKQLIRLEDFSRFEPVIGNPGDGASPSCALIDEYHEHASPDQLDTMQTGTGSREQPLVFVITTAGANIAGPCYQKRDEVVKVLNGVVEADDVFGIIYTLDKDDDWKDPAVWIKANPNIDVSVSRDYLASQVSRGVRSSVNQTAIKTKHFGLWVGARDGFVDMEKWRESSDSTLKPADFYGMPCYASIDMASKIDLAATGRLFVDYPDGRRHYYWFPHFYLPEDALVDNANEKVYRAWATDGHLEVMDGEEINFSEVEGAIKALDHDIREIAYDPWQTTQMAQNLREEGLNAVEFRNTVGNMSPAMREFEAALASGRIHHNGNPAMDWCASNLTAKEDAKDNLFPRKDVKANKIDGMVALLMAMGRAMYDTETGTLQSFLDSV